nr:hypothetical protein [Nocardioides sp. IC4_145]
MAGWTRPGERVFVPVTALLLAVTAVLAAVPTDVVIENHTETALLVLLAGVLAVAGGGPVTARVFTLVDREDTGASLRSAGAVLRGGAWIGALERAAVYATLVAGWPEGLAVVLALKGLGRYSELKTQGEGTAERFIIGTFASVLWAAACAAVVVLVRL